MGGQVLVGADDGRIYQRGAGTEGLRVEKGVATKHAGERLLRFQAFDQGGAEKPLTERSLRIGVH